MAAAISATDPEAKIAAGQAACRITAENLLVIPTTTAVELCIVNDGLKNVPESWICGNEYLGERNSEPWTFFYAE
jgi:ABC-type oligopeptide transport system substrate-binding subunit